DLFGRSAGILRHDLNDRRRGVGIGLDVDVQEGVAPAPGEARHEQQHNHPAGHRPFQQSTAHDTPWSDLNALQWTFDTRPTRKRGNTSAGVIRRTDSKTKIQLSASLACASGWCN